MSTKGATPVKASRGGDPTKDKSKVKVGTMENGEGIWSFSASNPAAASTPAPKDKLSSSENATSATPETVCNVTTDEEIEVSPVTTKEDAAPSASAGGSGIPPTGKTKASMIPIPGSVGGDPNRASPTSSFNYGGPVNNKPSASPLSDFDDLSLADTVNSKGTMEIGQNDSAVDLLLVASNAPPSPLQYDASAPPKLVFGKFEIDRGDPLHISDTEAFLMALDHTTNPPTRVVLKLMNVASKVLAELEGRAGVDDKYVLPILGVHVDKSDSRLKKYTGPTKVHNWTDMTKNVRSFMTGHIKGASGQQQKDEDDASSSCPAFPYALCLQAYDRTVEDVLTHDFIDFHLVRKIVKDLVVGLILLHTEKRIHGDLNPRSIVRVGTSWKISNLQHSKCIGIPTSDIKGCNEGYMPPEVAALLLETPAGKGSASSSSPTYVPDLAYDLFSLGCVLYQLIFGSPLWNINKSGVIPQDELRELAHWSPISFLEKASIRFPIDGRTENQKAALDLISKLLAPTPEDRRANFEFSVVSVRQHEFLQKKPLDPTALEGFKSKQDMMFRTERERTQYETIMQGLTLEEQWELKRSKDVLLFGMFEPAHVHIPTSFVVLKNKLPMPPRPDHSMSKKEAKKRLREGMKWVTSFNALDSSVKGALEGDVSAIGHFWSEINDMFAGDYMYLYWIDELTGRPVLGDGKCPDYPLEITTRSDTMPKLLPLMHLTMRAMALYHGVAGIARMFGCTLNTLPEELRTIAQAKVNELKQERGSTPFGSLEEDVNNVKSCKEHFMKQNSLRARSSRELVRFLEKKEGRKVDFAGLNRYADENGIAVWTCKQDSAGFKDAIKKRSGERLKEERNHWVDVQEEEIDALVRNIGEGSQKVAVIEKTLTSTIDELAKSTTTSNSLAAKVQDLEKTLEETQKEAILAKKELQEEKMRPKCGARGCVIQ